MPGCARISQAECEGAEGLWGHPAPHQMLFPHRSQKHPRQVWFDWNKSRSPEGTRSPPYILFWGQLLLIVVFWLFQLSCMCISAAFPRQWCIFWWIMWRSICKVSWWVNFTSSHCCRSCSLSHRTQRNSGLRLPKCSRYNGMMIVFFFKVVNKNSCFLLLFNFQDHQFKQPLCFFFSPLRHLKKLITSSPRSGRPICGSQKKWTSLFVKWQLWECLWVYCRENVCVSTTVFSKTNNHSTLRSTFTHQLLLCWVHWGCCLSL